MYNEMFDDSDKDIGIQLQIIHTVIDNLKLVVEDSENDVDAEAIIEVLGLFT